MMINGRNVKLYDSMFDYVEDADFGYYEIANGVERESPFIEAVKPVEDSNFQVYVDDTLRDGSLTYVKVNFGEEDDEQESFLIESELNTEVYLVYNKVEGKERTYLANSACFRTEELASYY